MQVEKFTLDFQPLIFYFFPVAVRASGHAAGARVSEPWVCGTGASLFQLTVKAPLALLVCQPERQQSESATSSSWACATDGHLDPLADLVKRNAYLSRREHVCVFRRRAPYAPRTPGAPSFFRSSSRLSSARWVATRPFLTGAFALQAVPQPLDRVQSHTGLKDSHRYPTLTRCHCRDPMITISAPHETFMACWQWWPGKHPNFQNRACQILLFQVLVTKTEQKKITSDETALLLAVKITTLRYEFLHHT